MGFAGPRRSKREGVWGRSPSECRHALGLLREIVGMAFDTLRTSKMRSALTVLGVVIGITSIVGMTSLLRGFDNSLRDSISQLGPDTIMVQKWGALSFAAGAASSRWRAGPISRWRMHARSSGSARRWRWSMSGSACTATSGSRIYYGRERTKQLTVFGATENWAAVNFAKVEAGPPLHPGGGRAPAQRGPARERSVAVALPEHGSDRQDGPHRQQPVHRDRRARQAAQPGRVLHRGATISP